MVSIIIPIYNVEKFVGEALKSALAQTYTDIEIIVVDDCGTDNSMSVVEKISKGDPRVSILHHDNNLGLSAARNTGIVAAKGEWIFFMDSDDLLEKDCISILVSLAEKYPGAEMIIGQYDELLPGEAPHPARWRQQAGVYQGDVIGPYVEEKIPATVWN